MKLRKKLIILALLVAPVLASIVALCYELFDFLQALIATIIGEASMLALAYFLLRQPVMDVKKLAEDYDKLRKKREYLREVNSSIFKRWKNISIQSRRFHLELVYDRIDLDLLNRGKEFLKL